MDGSKSVNISPNLWEKQHIYCADEQRSVESYRTAVRVISVLSVDGFSLAHELESMWGCSAREMSDSCLYPEQICAAGARGTVSSQTLFCWDEDQ